MKELFVEMYEIAHNCGLMSNQLESQADWQFYGGQVGDFLSQLSESEFKSLIRDYVEFKNKYEKGEKL